MANKIQEHVDSTGHMRWAYPNAEYYWVIGGAAKTDEEVSRLRQLLFKDLSRLENRCRRNKLTPVVLLTSTSVDAIVVNMLEKRPGFKTLVLGTGFIEAAKPNSVCMATADLILCYGEATETLSKLFDDQALEEDSEPPPTMITRSFEPLPKESKRLVKESDPYGQFWSDVERLRRWKPNPNPGLPIRDMLDLRPKYDI